MIELIYQVLEQVGFTHPLHPAVTHLPMGMSIGACLFGIASLKFEELARTAHHCVILALIFVPPTVVAGIMDWQHFFDGYWSTHIIIKMILAVVLTVLLLAAIRAGSPERGNPRAAIVLYALCLLTAVGLGYTGGDLQY